MPPFWQGDNKVYLGCSWYFPIESSYKWQLSSTPSHEILSMPWTVSILFLRAIKQTALLSHDIRVYLSSEHPSSPNLESPILFHLWILSISFGAKAFWGPGKAVGKVLAEGTFQRQDRRAARGKNKGNLQKRRCHQRRSWVKRTGLGERAPWQITIQDKQHVDMASSIPK